MPCSCCAYNCTERYTTIGSKYSFHRFPKDKRLTYIWCLSTRRKDFVPNKWTRICSKHFAKDAYEIITLSNGKVIRRLKKDAIPTVFNFDDNEVKDKKSVHMKRGNRKELTGKKLKRHKKEVFTETIYEMKYKMEKPGSGDELSTSGKEQEWETASDYTKRMLSIKEEQPLSEDYEEDYFIPASGKCTEVDVLKQTVVHLERKIEKLRALANMLEAEEYITPDVAFILRASISE